MANGVDLDFSFFGYSPLPKETRSRLHVIEDSTESKLKLRRRAAVKYSTLRQTGSSSDFVIRGVTATAKGPNKFSADAIEIPDDTTFKSSLIQSSSGSCSETHKQDFASYTCLPYDSELVNDGNELSFAAEENIYREETVTELSVNSSPKLIQNIATTGTGNTLLRDMSVVVISDSDSDNTSSSLSSGKQLEIKQTSSVNVRKFATRKIVIPETDSTGSSASGNLTSPPTKSMAISGTQIQSAKQDIVISESDSSHDRNGLLFENKKVANTFPKGKSKHAGYRNRRVILSSNSSENSACSKHTSLTSDKSIRNRKPNNIQQKIIIPSSDSSIDEDHRTSAQVVSKTIVLDSSDDEDESLPVSSLKAPVSRKIRPYKVADDANTLSNTKNVSHLTKSKKQDIEKWLDQNVTSKEKTYRGGEQMSIRNQETCSSPSLRFESGREADQENNRPSVAMSAEKLLDQLYGPTWQSAKKTEHPNVSSSESEDDFDKLMKKYVDGTRSSIFATQRLEDKRASSPDFINDEDISVNSVGFYQAIMNSDCKPNSSTDPNANCLLTTARRLSFLNLGSDEEDKEDLPLPVTGRPFLPPSDLNIVSRPKPKKKLTKKKASPPVQLTTSPHVFVKPTVLTSSTKTNVKLTEKKEHLQLRSFLESLSALTPAPFCDPEALDFKKNFNKKKDELCTKLFTMYNRNIFENKLPDNMRIEWNARMNRTAGFCYNRREPGPVSKEKVRSSRIELSTKVIDTADRLRDTLVHELCHAAVWIINGVQNGHGQFWKAWAAKAMRRYPELPLISRCHDYEIETKYTYKCTCCGYSIGRHSKSLDVLKKRCGYCYGTFELLINYKSKGGQTIATPKTPRNPTAFALYVKENYGSVKSNRGGLKHGEVMKLLGQQFAATKVTQEV